MEDFHREHLTDEQMAELNPIIRNAIATTLYAIWHEEDGLAARAHAAWHEMSVPNDWERPRAHTRVSRALRDGGRRTRLPRGRPRGRLTRWRI